VSRSTAATIPIFINCRDRLEPLIALLDFLERAGQKQIYLLDNESAYPPLLEFLSDTPHATIRLGRNVGRLALWDANVLADLEVTGRFVFSDPDVVPVEECPLDAIEYFGEILDAYPDRTKVGFGLMIDDLPDCYKFKDEVVVWESQFWEQALAPRLYDAPIDTTFALYRQPGQHGIGQSIRTGYPYVARHTPWYLDHSSLPEDEAFYRERADGSDVNHWGRAALPAWLAQEIASRQSKERAPTPSPLDQAQLLEVDALLASSAWAGEPYPVDEVRNTPWAEPGWHSWNNMSPEVEICDFVVALVKTLRPHRVIETGTGQGFVTRRVKYQLREGQQLACFELDSTWRAALGSLAFFDGSRCLLSPAESPDDEEMAAADLCFLDSDFACRLPEIERWWHAAPEGAVVLVHDAGNGHGRETPHALVRQKITELGIPGFFLRNPRGAFVGIKALRRHADLANRLAAVETELLVLRGSKTFRYSEPGRRLYHRLKRLRA
jgi:hypothetical protein